MSEWFYVRLALGLAWGVIGIYAIVLYRRTLRAEQAIREIGEGA
jgi:hypothetical protein